MKRCAVGIDMGGTNMRLALVDEEGEVVSSRRSQTDASEGRDSVISRLVSEINSLISEEPQDIEVMGVGIGAPGLIEKGVVQRSPNLPGWVNVPLKEIIESEVKLPVILENDANAVAYGEKSLGAGKGRDSIICLTLGTGVGGGVILERKIWRGAFGMAGEVGHTTVEPEGVRCACGNRGCLEVYASATGIKREALEVMKRGDASWDASSLTMEFLDDAAAKGDKAAMALFNRAGRYLGIGISNLLNVLNPDAVVIGGGVSKAWDRFAPAMMDEINLRCFREISDRTGILPAVLGDMAGMLGAARLAFEDH